MKNPSLIKPVTTLDQTVLRPFNKRALKGTYVQHSKLPENHEWRVEVVVDFAPLPRQVNLLSWYKANKQKALKRLRKKNLLFLLNNRISNSLTNLRLPRMERYSGRPFSPYFGPNLLHRRSSKSIKCRKINTHTHIHASAYNVERNECRLFIESWIMSWNTMPCVINPQTFLIRKRIVQEMLMQYATCMPK